MNKNEFSKIHHNNNGERPENNYLKYSLGPIELPLEKLKSIKEVISVISKQNDGVWPEDDIWQRELPFWFIKAIELNSVEDILKDNTLWDFGSWLDAMKFRGWEWYSSRLLKSSFIEIIFDPQTFPYSVGPFEYVLKVVGIDQERIEFVEL